MRVYKPENYKDYDQVLNEIKSLFKKIDGQLLILGFDYVNKISGKIKNDRFYDIRDSITLRIQSVLFHFQLFDSIHNPNKKLIVPNYSPIGTMALPIQQKFLFDSIIFNTISIYDYLGCLINFIIEKNKDRWEKTWSRLENIARTNKSLKNTSLGKTIISCDKEWIGKLNEYRAELIHYRTEFLGSSETYSLKECKLDILILAPNQLFKYFKTLKEIKNKEDLNINAIALWIIKTSFEIIIEINEEIKIYLEEHRLIPIGNEIYKIKKTNAP